MADRDKTLRVFAIGAAVFAAALGGMWLWRTRVVDPWAGRAREVAAPSGELRSGEVRNYSVPGAFGDSFAPILGLMTAAALAATVSSVFMQSIELREAREQFTAQADALKEANIHAARANELERSAQVLEAQRQLIEVDAAGAALVQAFKTEFASLEHYAGPTKMKIGDVGAMWLEYARTPAAHRHNNFADIKTAQLEALAARRDELVRSLDLLKGEWKV